MFKVKNKDTRTTPTPCCSVSIVKFEHAIANWELFVHVQQCIQNLVSHFRILQNRSIVDVRPHSKYLSDVFPLSLTTTVRTTSFPQSEDIRLDLKFLKSKSNTIVTNFHSFDSGSILFTRVLTSYNCNSYYICSYTHM